MSAYLTAVTRSPSSTCSGSASDGAFAFGLPGSDDYQSIEASLDSPVTSGGIAVVLAASADADGWWIASAGLEEVFRFQTSFAGVTNLRFSQPIDHTPAGDNGENTQTINLGLTLRDADGDLSNTIIQAVDVIDDVPEDRNRIVRLTEGSNKIIQVLQNGEGGADTAELTEITYFNASSGMLETYSIARGDQLPSADHH